ncbi:hypothetical protein QFC22_006043 [Naganishia vaughanmartiniae]|uniref:Uncharacterized protein n=1 Tax=Naganishia vaughanmartiniae TaxID=1424756 RepID=A0ACC2WPW6_9TREE|nr:hypothetical protein QFC22_006043 [Naganishia vaughanmartiniae]
MTKHKRSPDSRRDSGAMELQEQLFTFPQQEQHEGSKEDPMTSLYSSFSHSTVSATPPMPSSNTSAPSSSANDSTPSFRNFLDGRSSTSLSEQTQEQIFSKPSMKPDDSFKDLLDKKYDDEQAMCASPKAAPRPIRHHSEFSIHSSPGDRQRQVNTAVASSTPETVSPQALPVFQFLQEKTTTIEMGIAGLQEWVGFWISRGRRVRVLAKEMEEVRNELQNRLKSGCISPLACVEQTSKLEAIFSAEEITSRVPPRMHRYPALLDDAAMSMMDEKMVTDCLVAANDRLVRPQQKRGLDVKEFTKPLEDMSDHPFRGSTTAEPGATLRFPTFIPPQERTLRGPTSPKAKRLLGIHALATPSSTASSTPVSASTPIRPSPLTPASKHLTPNKSTNFLDLSSPTTSLRSTKSFLSRFRSFSRRSPRTSTTPRRTPGGKSVLASLIGSESSLRSYRYGGQSQSRTATYFRSVVDLFRQQSPEDAETRLDRREQIRSAPVMGESVHENKIGTTSFTAPRRAHYPVQRDKSYRKPAPSVDIGSRAQARSTGSVQGMKLPAIDTQSPFASPRRRTTRHVANSERRSRSDRIAEEGKGKQSGETAVHVEQIMEVLLEYVNRLVRRSVRGGKVEREGTDGLLGMVKSLNHISFETRVRILNKSNAIHPLLASTLQKVRFSLGYIDAKHLVQAVERIENDGNGLQLGILRRPSADHLEQSKIVSVKKLVIAWLSDLMQRVVRECLEEALLPMTPIPPVILDFRNQEVARSVNNRPQRSVSVSSAGFANSLKPPGTSLISDIKYRNGSMPTLPIFSKALSVDTPAFETVEGLVHWIFAEPTTTNTRELLIQWISNERLRRIRSGEGWLIRLQPNGLTSPHSVHGPATMSAVLARVARQCVSRKQAHLMRVVDEVQALYNIPVSTDKSRKRTTISGKAVTGNDVSHQITSTAASIRRNCLGVGDEADRIPQAALSKDKDQPPLGKNTLTPSDGLSSKNRNISHMSGHSYGELCDDASVFATVDTFSHNSCYTTMSSAPATQRLALLTFSDQSFFGRQLQPESAVPKASLNAGSRTSAPALLSCQLNTLTQSPDADLVSRGSMANLNMSRDTAFDAIHIRSSLLLDSAPIFEQPASVVAHAASQTFPFFDGPAPVRPPSQGLHSSPSFPGSLSTTSGSLLSALSFVLPMFNQDCSVRYSVTPGQLEINLLKMIEFERQNPGQQTASTLDSPAISNIAHDSAPSTPNLQTSSPMYRHPHRSAVSLQTTPVMQRVSLRDSLSPQPDIPDSARSKTSSSLTMSGHSIDGQAGWRPASLGWTSGDEVSGGIDAIYRDNSEGFIFKDPRALT